LDAFPVLAAAGSKGAAFGSIEELLFDAPPEAAPWDSLSSGSFCCWFILAFESLLPPCLAEEEELVCFSVAAFAAAVCDAVETCCNPSTESDRGWLVLVWEVEDDEAAVVGWWEEWCAEEVEECWWRLLLWTGGCEEPAVEAHEPVVEAPDWRKDEDEEEGWGEWEEVDKEGEEDEEDRGQDLPPATPQRRLPEAAFLALFGGVGADEVVASFSLPSDEDLALLLVLYFLFPIVSVDEGEWAHAPLLCLVALVDSVELNAIPVALSKLSVEEWGPVWPWTEGDE
jgi:hypothetical protein